MHFTTSDEERLIGWHKGPLRSSWAFLADGKEIGEVYEGGTGGYLGRLYAPGGRDVIAAYTTPEMDSRSAVIDRLIRVVLVRLAKEKGLDTLRHEDIDDVATGYPTIDGMSAYQWIDAMTMD